MPVYKDKDSNTWMIRTYIDSSPSITMDVFAYVLDSLRSKEKKRLNSLKTSPKTSPDDL